jgi:hypothetical protein
MIQTQLGSCPWKDFGINNIDTSSYTTRDMISRRLPTAAARVRARSGHVGFVVDKVALG